MAKNKEDFEIVRSLDVRDTLTVCRHLICSRQAPIMETITFTLHVDLKLGHLLAPEKKDAQEPINEGPQGTPTDCGSL